MESEKEFDWEVDLNLKFPKYARHFIANQDRYSQDEGFYYFQIQNALDESPRADDVSEDLETMAEAGILEKEEVGGSSKMPDQYFLNSSEEYETSIEGYAEKALGWVSEYRETLKRTIT